MDHVSHEVVSFRELLDFLETVVILEDSCHSVRSSILLGLEWVVSTREDIVEDTAQGEDIHGFSPLLPIEHLRRLPGHATCHFSHETHLVILKLFGQTHITQLCLALE